MLDGSLSLVIPAHNEVENIGQVMRQCALTLPKFASDYESMVWVELGVRTRW